MTTQELAESFLAHLYGLAEEAPHPNFLFSVNEFAPKLGIVDRQELQRALDYLGDRGLIVVAGLDRFGGISAGITAEGSIFVEKGGETGMIEQYRKKPETFEGASSETFSSPAVGRERKAAAVEEKERLFFARSVEAILQDMEDVLERDGSVSDEAKKDLLSDLATLRIQMGRNVKNRQIIDAVLENLSGIPSIAPLAAGLASIAGGYFR